MAVMDNLSRHTQAIFSRNRIFSQFDEPTEKTGLWLKTLDIYDNIICTDDNIYESTYTWKSPSRFGTLPFKLDAGCAIIYRGEIHLLGSWDSGYETCHYKWDGTKWVQVSVLPYAFLNGSVVIYNDQIHILGGSSRTADTSGTNASATAYNHYKWDGTAWSSVSTLPYMFYAGEAIVWKNEIHILGSLVTGHSAKHYKWDGTAWSSVSTLPFNAYYQSCVIWNNQLHIMGSQYTTEASKSHYKWDGTAWSSVSTLPYSVYRSSAYVLDNQIHLLGSGGEADQVKHYKWDGTAWSSVSILPIHLGTGVIVKLDNGFMIGGGSFANQDTAEYTKSVKSIYKPYSVLIMQGSTVNYNVNLSVICTHEKIIRENIVKCTDIKTYGSEYIIDLDIFVGNGEEWIQVNKLEE